MILTHLKGGLGNQLFQYAFGRRLAEDAKTDLKLDISELGAKYDRKYGLNNFRINAAIATEDEIRRMRFPYGRLSELVRQIKRKLFYAGEIVYQPSKVYTNHNRYIEGYWQNENYFATIATILRKELQLADPLTQVADQWNRIISSDTTSVSVHCRRGDFVNLECHGCCSPEYFGKAARHVLTEMGRSHFYLFSDDLPWALSNLVFPGDVTPVSSENLNDFEELFLMSCCRSHIIANSSFSWWGAWLDANREKIVAAPQWWLAGRIRTENIVPSSWEVIE